MALEHLFAAVFEQSPLPMMVLAPPEYRCTLANPALERLFDSLGQSPFVGHTIAGTWPEDILRPYLSVLDRVCQTGQPHSITSPSIRLKGDGRLQERFLKFGCYPVFSAGNQIERILVIGEDITERMLLDRRLEKADQLQALLNSMVDEVWFTDAEGNPSAGNAQAVYGPGFDDLEQIRRPVSELQADLEVLKADGSVRSPDEAPLFRTLKGEVITGGIEIIRHRKTGELRYRQFNMSPVRDAAGHITGIVSVVRDITEQKRLQDAEINSEREKRRAVRELPQQVQVERNMWRALFNTIPDPVVVFDETGRILESNSANDSLLPFSAPPAMLPNFSGTPALYYPDGRVIPDGARPMRRILDGESLHSFACSFLDPPRKERLDLLLSGGPLYGDSPKKVYYRIAHDVTEMRRLERVRDDFLQVVAHELRNPLQVMKGVTQVLALRLPAESKALVARHIDSLQRQVDQMTHIIDDLLQATRVTHPSFTLNMAPTAVADILEESLSFLTLVPHGKSMAVETRGLDGLVVEADKKRMAEVLNNLLGNAIKYTRVDGHIWVVVHKGADHVDIRVEDDGIGIPEDEQEKVFQGFYRSKNLAEWGAGGLGLGLYVSRNIARAHGGDLWAASRPGGGTVMCLRIPLVQSTANAGS